MARNSDSFIRSETESEMNVAADKCCRRLGIEKRRKTKRRTIMAIMYLIWSLQLTRRNRELRSSTWNAAAEVAVAEGGVRGFVEFWWMRVWWSSSSSEEESIRIGL